METPDRTGGAASTFLPEVSEQVDSLSREMRRSAAAGDSLSCVVQALAGNGRIAQQAMAALGLAGAVWRVHQGAAGADSILAGDALLTRALELGTTLPDPRCRWAFLTYVARAFSAVDGSAKLLLAAAVEIGSALGGWVLEPEDGTPAGGLAEVVRAAGGPLIVSRGGKRPPESLQNQLADVLASPELSEWR